MRKPLDDCDTTVSIGGRTATSLRFADDIYLLAGNNAELQKLTNKLASASERYGMEVSSEKSKVMVNSIDTNASADIVMNGQKLEEVDSFRYLGALITKDGSCRKDILARIAQAMAAMSKLDEIWKCNRLSFKTKLRLYRTLVIPILLYGCESWTLNADTAKRLEAFEMEGYRRLLHISWTEHKTNEFVCRKVVDLAGDQESLLSIVKRRKLTWFGHVTRHNSLTKTIMQGFVEGTRR